MNTVVYNTEQVVNPQPKRFEPYPLVDQNSYILHTKMPKFEFNNPNIDPTEIAYRLIETAKLHKIYSMAANQVGLLYNICVVGCDDAWVGFFNPEIVSYSDDEVLIAEADISNVGLLLYIKRPSSVTVQYQDFNGETKLTRFDGLTARILQQNIDRLHGIDFKSKVSSLKVDRANKSLNKKIKRFVRSNMRAKK